MSRFPEVCRSFSRRSIVLALLATLALAGPVPSALAVITPEGDVLPSDLPPASWTTSTDAYIGQAGSGTLTVDAGSGLLSYFCEIGCASTATGVVNIAGSGSTWTNRSALYVGGSGSGTLNITNGGTVSNTNANVGYANGSSGRATVDGVGSTWTNNGILYVGEGGSGTLSITNGGSVSVTWETKVGIYPGSTGVIQFGSNGGTLTTGGLYASATQLTGTGTINTCGLVSDVNLAFDTADDLKQTFTLGQNITVNLDLASNPDANGDLGAGLKGTGSLTIQGGVEVNSDYGYLGYSSGSTGVATVSGTSSTWNNNENLYVGYRGSGTLSIRNHGTVKNSCTYIGMYPGSTGAVVVNGVGSILSSYTGVRIGWMGSSGTLSITGGGSVHGGGDYIGDSSGLTGVVTVDGAGSKWTDDVLIVGYNGNGRLSIANGGSVSNSRADIGYNSGSTGAVTVDGNGSTWNTGPRNIFNVGKSGSGTLLITGGGTVTTPSISINNVSLLAIDAGHNSSLNVKNGTGPISNGGTLRLLAAANIAAGNYTPIISGAWSGTGTYQAVGGILNTSTHVFTASSAAAEVSGAEVDLNLALVQRAMVSDIGADKTGWVVGGEFSLAAAVQTDITFTATAIGDGILDALTGTAGEFQTVLGGWTFETSNYEVSASRPVYLSIKVGAEYPAECLEVWHYDGSAWAAYSPTDLTYDGMYASFTATGLSGYAVTAPEPGTLALLAAGLLTLLAYGRRKRA